MLGTDRYSLHIQLLEHKDLLNHCLKDFFRASSDLILPTAVDLQACGTTQLHLDSVEMYYKGAYLSSKTESLALGSGMIHLYKTRMQEEEQSRVLTSPSTTSIPNDVLAILAVPSYMTSADILGYFGESLQNISHIRILRTDDLRRFLVLLKFRSVDSAESFQDKFNGALFNPMEPETVHCIPIISISFSGQVRPAGDFPILTTQAEDGSRVINRQSHKAMPPAMTLMELPTCVVCLERMDSSTTGLLTIACEHTFHCACLSKWVDTQASCPICRFSVARDVLKESEKHCFSQGCSSDKNLWMCLICGVINCGRYESQHAINHFNLSKHAFAMDLDSGRIWDYSTDSYVHRLLEDKIGASSLMSKQGSATKTANAGAAEFEELLAAQLESQRLYYEEQVSSAIKKASNAVRQAQAAEALVEELRSHLKDKEASYRQTRDELQESRDAQVQLRGKSKIITEIAQRSRKQADEEQVINASLMQRIAHFEKSMSVSTQEKRSMQDEIAELKEQVRDLMVHFASVQTVERLDSTDLSDAKIQVAPKASNSSPETRRSARKSKNKAV